MTGWMRAGRGEAGSATLELAILAPVLMILLGLVIVAARLEAAAGALEHAAAAAAREASLARSPQAAVAAARTSVATNLAGSGVSCLGVQVSVDVSGFAVHAGTDANVIVGVSCLVSLSDQAVPGMPGSRQLSSRAISPLDRFRSR